MDEIVMHENGNSQKPHEGRWVSEGGRLRWIPGIELDDDQEEEFNTAGDAIGELDEAAWASDTPPLPSGAPESARVRAALAWLTRQRDEQRERAAAMAVADYQAQRQRDAQPPPRRRRGPEPPSAAALDTARYDGAADWFEVALIELQEQVDRNSGRALVEWYLWLLAANTPIAIALDDPIAIARTQGSDEARERARQHAEQLSLPDMDEE